MSCFGCCGGGSARNRAADEYSLRESASRARHRNPQDSPNNMGTGEQSSHQANGAQGVYGGLPRSTSAAGGQDPHSVRHSKSFKTPNVGVYFEGKPEAPLSSLTDAAVGDSREFTDQKRSRRDLKRTLQSFSSLFHEDRKIFHERMIPMFFDFALIIWLHVWWTVILLTNCYLEMQHCTSLTFCVM